MDVKDAVLLAKKWLADVLQEESIMDVGLEEVTYDDKERLWDITLGFSRPWNRGKSPLSAITGEPALGRTYRVISVDDLHDRVVSMRRAREPAD